MRLLVCAAVYALAGLPFLEVVPADQPLYFIPAVTGTLVFGAICGGAFLGYWPVWSEARHNPPLRILNTEVVVSVLGQVVVCAVLLYFLFPEDAERPVRLTGGVLAYAAYVGAVSGYLLHWLNRTSGL